MAEALDAAGRDAGAPRIVIAGAGPAGLTAAWELARLGHRAELFERDTLVGGISQTVDYRGYRFDLGGHRFFTKVGEVFEIWREVLGEDFLERPRLSRIYYDKKFFDYPLKPVNALAGLGPIEAVRIAVSFARAKLFPEREERNLEQWVSNRFGRRLFEIFFKTYTEKVWGMACTEISADWAAQRIQNLDLKRAVISALFEGRAREVKSLIHRFHYPRLGPGMMWERAAARLAERGSPTRLATELVRIAHDGGRVTAITVRDAAGGERSREVDHLICSIPLGRAAQLLDPPPPPEVLAAAAGLRHRDFLTVMVVVDAPELFADNWIYIHEPDVRVGRIQNFKNWSPEMVADPATTALGLEYFVNRGDELWNTPDGELIELATRELRQLGLDGGRPVRDGAVVRVPCAYPVYDDGYRERIATVRGFLERLPNLQMIGRNGQHRYNNQDHSMLTGIYAARTVAGDPHPIWDVNVDGDYHEEVKGAGGDRLVPAAPAEPTLDELLDAAFARFDATALGAAVGAVAGLGLFLATAFLVLFHGGEPGDTVTLSLLAAYLTGYSVSWPGALLGLLEGGVLGFALGAAIAGSLNTLLGWVESTLHRELDEERALDLPKETT
jgi:protoporphyrinogen oxidase